MSSHVTSLARFPAFLLRQAADLDLDPERLVAEAGLTPRDLEDPDGRIQARKNIQLWRVVLESVDDPDLGIRLGSALRVRDIGLVGYTMMHSVRLGDALGRLARFGRILADDFPPQLRTTGDRAEFSIEPLPEQRVSMNRLADFDLAATLSVLRQITEIEIVPIEVHFPYRQAAEGTRARREFFGGRLRFDQPWIRLVLTRKSLELPIQSADDALGRYLDQLAEQVLESLAPGGSLAEKVDKALWMQIKDGRPQLESVAAALAMSPRSLQRRLREEGTSFVGLLDEFRHRFSLLLLEDRELAVYEVAYLLGYSEPSTFYRAFRRWTESSPQEYRAAVAKG